MKSFEIITLFVICKYLPIAYYFFTTDSPGVKLLQPFHRFDPLAGVYTNIYLSMLRNYEEEKEKNKK